MDGTAQLQTFADDLSSPHACEAVPLFFLTPLRRTGQSDDRCYNYNSVCIQCTAMLGALQNSSRVKSVLWHVMKIEG